MATARTLVVLLLTVAVAGCLGAWSDPSDSDGRINYETYVFDDGGAESPAIDGGIRYPTENHTPREFYLTLVATDEEAARFDRAGLDDDTERFVDRTDFDRSFIVVFQAFPASSVPDYRVEALEWRDGELHLSVDDSSDGGTDDVTVETLLVVVDRGDRGVPDSVTVTTEEGVSISIERVATTLRR